MQIYLMLFTGFSKLIVEFIFTTQTEFDKKGFVSWLLLAEQLKCCLYCYEQNECELLCPCVRRLKWFVLHATVNVSNRARQHLCVHSELN